MSDAEGPCLRVIYIMGAARSGSTILGIALGNQPNVFYAGELDLYTRENGVPTGDEHARPAFWETVREQVEMEDSDVAMDWHRWFEHPRALVNGGLGRSSESYKRYHGALYCAIAESASCRTIVDSSHYPLRRWNLRGVPAIDISTIYLVRDPVSVLRSLQTDERPKGLLGANVYLWVVQLLSEVIFRLVGGKKLRIRLRTSPLIPSEYAPDIGNERHSLRGT